MKKILVINPGSTSTKIGVYQDNECLFVKNIHHDNETLSRYEQISDQFEIRKNIILEELAAQDIALQSLDAVIGRGGLVKPIKSGIYEVNDSLINDLKAGVNGQHASNLGGLIAQNIVEQIPGARAFIADPVVVDELEDIARISGNALFERQSIFHALNHKAVGRAYAKKVGEKYEELNLIIAHMGGGSSVGAHRKGRVIDVNNALDGDGPFSPERSGGVPAGALVRLCFSGKVSLEEMKKQLTGKGGFVSYLGTNNGIEVENNALAGDKKAALIFNAMGYQVAKEIGAMSAVLKGEVDAIILTGGLAYSKPLTAFISEHVAHLATVHLEAGEDELNALASNALMALNNEIEVALYK